MTLYINIMTEEKFLIVWNQLYQWNLSSKFLFDTGVDLTKHDKQLYNIVIHLLQTYYNEAQLDFFIWSIFETEPRIDIDEKSVLINTAELCWQYINNL